VTPRWHDVDVSETALFTTAAQQLGYVAARFGLAVPGFRSPPRVVGVERTLRRRNGGGVVAVAVRGRPFPAVLADMIDGVVLLNNLPALEAARVRNALWHEAATLLQYAPNSAIFTTQRVA